MLIRKMRNDPVGALAVALLCAMLGLFMAAGHAARAQQGAQGQNPPGGYLAGQAPQASWGSGSYPSGGSVANSSSTAVNQMPLWLPYAVTFGHITVTVATADASNKYSFGIYSATSGNAICTTVAAVQASTGGWKLACSQGTVTAGPGLVVFALAGAATTLKIAEGGAGTSPFSSATSSTATTAGQVPPSIAAPTVGTTSSTSYANVVAILN